jgi:DNA-binding beta-propeller fold protein YncE
MKYATRIATFSLAVGLVTAGSVFAQTAKPNSQAALMREAKITKAVATKTALEQVPGGKVRSSELEREKGKLIYSFDIKVAGKSGIEEINVDAMTGAIVAHEHEGPKAEKKEALQDALGQGVPGTSYHIVGKIAAGGEGGWDYLIADTASERLYVSRGTHVMVVDLARDSVIGDIPNTPGVHGIALARALGRGFTSNGRDTTVTIFDLKTLAPIARVKVTGRNPDAIVYDPASGRVFTFNGGGANTTAIDGATGAVVGTIDLGGKPEFAVSDGKGTMYVNIEDKSEVVAFDSKGLTVKHRWPLAPCEEPSGMAMDRASARLFAVCSNKLMAVLDLATGRVIATLPIGQGVDASAFDPATGLAFASNGEGTLTVVREDSPDKFTVVGTVPTQRGARTMALDAKTHRIYLSTAEFGPPPAPTAERPNPRPPMIPGTFTILVLDR